MGNQESNQTYLQTLKTFSLNISIINFKKQLIMKFKFMSLAAMAACVAFTSCSNDDEPGANKGNVALTQVSVGINHVANSRAGITATSFSGNESIGLYLFGGAGVDEADATAKRYNQGLEGGTVKEPLNVKYTRGGDEANTGNPEWWTSTNPIILSSKVGKLYAYYPYAETNADATGLAIPTNIPAAQGTGISDGTKDVAGVYDYMYGLAVSNEGNNNVSNNTTHVDFQMNHALTMVSFKFVRDTYPGEGKISKIKLYNDAAGEYLKAGAATMHIGTGAISGAVASTEGVYCLPEQVLTDVGADDESTGLMATIPHMLVYPNATPMTAGTVRLEITMDGKVYDIELPNKIRSAQEPYTWVAGKNYVYTLKMTGYGFGANDEDGKDDIDVTIKEWDEDFVEDGNLTKPIN